MFNGILNLDNKESIIKEFSNMVESVEKEITDENREAVNKKLDVMKQLIEDIKKATTANDLNVVMDKFIKENPSFSIQVGNIGFTLATDKDDVLADSEFTESLVGLSVAYAKNFLDHLQAHEISIGNSKRQNVAEFGKEEDVLLVMDGEHIYSLDTLLEAYTNAFKYAVESRVKKKLEFNKMKLKAQEAKNNLKI